MSPFSKLLLSRKFLLLVADTVFALIALGIGEFVSPEAGAFVMKVVGLLQPVLIAVIVGIALEDAALKLSRYEYSPSGELIDSVAVE